MRNLYTQRSNRRHARPLALRFLLPRRRAGLGLILLPAAGVSFYSFMPKTPVPVDPSSPPPIASARVAPVVTADSPDQAPEFAGAGQVTPEQMQALDQRLADLLKEAPARAAAVYVEDIPTGLSAGVNANRFFLAASLIKLPVMAAAYEHWEKRPERKNSRSLDWLERMITVSDNPSTDALIDMVGGPEVVTRLCATRGWPNLKTRHAINNHRGRRGLNECTAREMVEFLVALDKKSLVEESADEEMWEVLRRQKKRARIPAGLPERPGVEVGNKTGTLGNALHDAGIVRTPFTRYAVCVLLSGQRSESAGNQFCRRVSRTVFEGLHEGPARDQLFARQ